MIKYLLITGFTALLVFPLQAQNSDSASSQVNKPGYEVTENEDIEITTDQVVKKGPADTTNFMIGDTEVSIIEEEGETSITLKDQNSDDEDTFAYEFDEDENNIPEKTKGKFKGHWAGFEFGLNNYVNDEFSLTRSAESEFMEINTGKSWNYNLNFAQYSIPLLPSRYGLVTGLGFEWSNYHFENQNSITKNKTDGVIEALPFTTISPEKNRLQTTYLTVPLLMELQLLEGDRSDRIHMSAGVIAGIKLFSNTKVTYFENGSKQKIKQKSDYYLTPLRFGFTGRVGYKLVKLYVNYYFTPLFIEERGPELYPIAAGLALSF